METASKPQQAVITLRQGGIGIGLLPSMGVVVVSGADALTFMQNRTSNDVLALAEGEGHANTVLDRSAKVQAVFSLHRHADSLTLLTDTIQIPLLVEELERYHILEQVSFSDRSADQCLLTIQGISAGQVLSTALDANGLEHLPEFGIRVAEGNGAPVTVVRRTLTGEPGYIVILETASEADSLLTRLEQTAREHGVDTTLLDEESLNILRVEAGIPRFERDLTTETLLPETGLEQIAVSYTKGCYLGQETVARVKTYGAVQRALVGLILPKDASLPKVDAPCLLDGQPIGTVKSSVHSPTLDRPIALAYLGKDHRVPDQSLTLTFGDDPSSPPIEVRVCLLPFYTSEQVASRAKEALDNGLRDFAEGRDDEAITQLRQAVALDPTLADAYEALGVMLSRRDEFEEAIALTHKLAELDPDRIMARTNLSVFYMKIGDKERAEEEKAKATVLGMKQKAREAGLTLDLDAERQKRQEAARQRIQMFKDALQYSPDDPLGNFGLASAYLELEDFASAVEPFQKTLKAQPNHSTAFLSLGKAYEGLKQLEDAINTYRSGIEVASKKRDLMPLKEMQQRLDALENTSSQA